MKKLIPILLIMAIIASPALARNSKMKGENNPILTYKNEDLIHKVWLKTTHGPVLYKVIFEPIKDIESKIEAQQERINKLEEQLDYIAIRIGKLEENQKPVQENEYPIFTPNKYDFSNEAE